MLTYNIDTSDGLTNGTTGTVVDFVYRDSNLYQVMVQLDDERAGKSLRSQNRTLLRKYSSSNVVHYPFVGDD